MRNFMQLLKARMQAGFCVCVGLDSDYEQLPMQHVPGPWRESTLMHSKMTMVILNFNIAIVEATTAYALAYKPNFAFYLEYGLPGLDALHQTIAYIQNYHSEIPVILDAKVGDIGNTNKAYVKALLDSFLQADAITVHNYLGQIAMQEFLSREDKGVFVLCKTSNPGSGEFQDTMVLLSEEEQMTFGVRRMLTFERVAARVHRYWNQNGNCGLVVGATYPDELAKVRKLVGDDCPLLIPGIGKQGGDLERTVAAGRDSKGQGMLINSSSGIIFASKNEDFAAAAGREAEKLHNQIRSILAQPA